MTEIIPDYDRYLEAYFDSLLSGVNSLRARNTLEREPMIYSVITEEKPPLMARYKGIELQTAPDNVRQIFQKWKSYWKDIENNKPVRIKYHW